MQKLNAAESIRGLACLAVVCSHLSLSFFPDLHHFDLPLQAPTSWGDWIHHSPFGFWFSGTAAVYVFFVLSGFLLSHAIYRVADSSAEPQALNFKVKNMFYKRYLRLAIPVLGSCLLTWLIFNSFSVDAQHTRPWLAEYLGQQVELSQAFYQGTIGSFFFAQSSVNWVLWTMQIELFGSFLLFALIYLQQKSQLGYYLGLLLFGLISFLYLSEGLFLGLSCFVIGMLIYRHATRLSWGMAVLMLGLGLYLAGMHDSSYSYQWLFKLVGPPSYEYSNYFAGILVVYSILMSPRLSTLLDRPSLVKLGQWSFSIYLLHLPLLYLICVPILNQLIHWQWQPELALSIALLLFMCGLMLSAAMYSRYVDGFAIWSSQKMAQWIQKRE
ncbi:peptidoglycan/LPS O-acetylase OafA/YrhL [Acinetobacter calcoaceticus]|uniref:Peptidoglycan/LPS O-acetylase OafA/YrhL n=1 Tax=Acinetobacter calcoaceticus TaxID=471 RepID=A0A4R1XNP1_ACICA|nr:peptidoglycan/LPS O-acetylase OafA/YrhL [Acinetobacter calcoaceticus]